jgi:hypothetical protein
MVRRSNIQVNDRACLLQRTGFFVFATLLLITVSCDTVNQQGGTAGRIMPNISGGTGEVLVVMDQKNWSNAAGDLMQDMLKQEFPGLPQSEPLFDVIQVTAPSFEGVYKFHRSIVLTTVSSGLEPKIRYRENIWAKPQIMVQIEAPTAAVLGELIGENEEQIIGFLTQYDRKRLMNVYKDSKDPAIQKDLTTNHQIRLAIPRGYNMDFSKEDFTSVSIESPDLSQVIQVYEYPAKGPEDLNVANVIEKRNSFTKTYVEGPTEGSYMTISQMYEPIAYDLKKNNTDVIELRGLWDLKNGFMGGPFVSHSIYDANRGRIVTVEGYLYHPNQKKRVNLRQLEAIIYSMEIL